RRRDKLPNEDGIVWKFFERGQRLRLKVVEQPPDNVVQIAATFTQVFVIQAVVRLEKFVADLLYRPLGIDAIGFDLFDNPIDEQPVLQHEQMRVDEKRRFRAGL